MRYFIYCLIVIFFAKCSEPDADDNDEVIRESCDFSICEEGRNVVDTIRDAYGMLRQQNNVYYIEVTDDAPEPDTLLLSCVAPEIKLPETGNYVKCTGLVKDPCADKISTSKDSLLLQEIEVILPQVEGLCETKIVQGEFDVNKIDAKLHILHLEVVDGCLRILVSYIGSCDQLPDLRLHYGGDILFGNRWLMDVTLQGTIDDNCNKKNYAVLQFDITPLGDILPDNTPTKLILRFLSQGYLMVSYYPNQ